MQEFITWAIGIGVTVVAAAAGVFKWMWTKLQSYIAECEKDRNALRSENLETRQEVLGIKETLAVFEGCTTSPCGAMQSLEQRRKFRETYHIKADKKP